MASQTYRYQLTKTEWLAAALLWMRRKPLIFVNTIMAVLCVVAAITVCTLLLLQSARAHVPARNMLENIAAFGVLIVGFAGLAFYRLRREIKRWVQPDWGKQITLNIDDVALIAKIPGASDRSHLWAAIRRLVETEKLGLIYSSQSSCIAFPKRAVPAEAITLMNNSISDAKELR